MRTFNEFIKEISMVSNQDRAIGCLIGYNAVIKAVRYIERYDSIDPNSSKHLRRVLKTIYGKELYNYYRSQRRKLRVVK